MHKYGDVVLYQLGNDTVKALVVQSNPQIDGEHLTVVYLDPKAASSSMSGMMVDKAIARAFAPPLTEGKTYGWKDIAVEVQPEKPPVDALFELLQSPVVRAFLSDPKNHPALAMATGDLDPKGIPSAADLDAVAEEQKAAVATDPTQAPTSDSAEPVNSLTTTSETVSSTQTPAECLSQESPSSDTSKESATSETPKPIPTTSTFSGPAQ